MPDLTPLFGLLIIDRDPLTFADLPGLAQAWFMDAGGFAFIGLALYLLYVLLGRLSVNDSDSRKSDGTKFVSDREQRFPLSMTMVLCFAAALIAYAVYGLMLFGKFGLDQVAAERIAKFDPTGYNKYLPPALSWKGQPVMLSLAGLFAIIGIGAPFFGAMVNLFRRAASTGRAPTGTPGLFPTFGLVVLAWIVLGVAGWQLSTRVPALREWIGVGTVIGCILVAGWGAYRCRLGDRFGPVYAVAKLSVLDVIRSRAFLALLVLYIPALFPITWFIPFKPEDELRLTVGMTSTLTQVVLLLMASLLASFAIPNDVKNQNIYTVLTKPVQPFDVVLGRFFGYSALATAALVAMTLGGWLLIEASTISPQAREETFKARVPVRGELRFASRVGDNIKGTDVGREFNYREYITGHPLSSQRGVWSFTRLPSSLRRAQDQAVPLEMTFDIYRLTKGVEDRAVDVNIRIVSWRCPQVPPPPDQRSTGTWRWEDTAQEARYQQRARELLSAANPKRFPVPSNIGEPKVYLSQARPGSPEWGVANELAREFGFYEILSKEVADYHPTKVLVPAALFENAASTTDADGQPLPARTDPATGKPLPVPPLQQVQVYVKCETSSQMLGMAEGDLYLLEAEQSFGQNYFKAAFGLWCRLVVLIGLAVVCSTYLAGVVSFLTAGVLFVLGYFGQYITELAMGKSVTGGPLQSISALSQARLSTSQTEPTGQAISLGDNAFAYLIRRVVNLFPDVYAYDWSPFLAEGFNVSFENLAMNFLVMVGYLLPWFILGFYLIRSREVAA